MAEETWPPCWDGVSYFCDLMKMAALTSREVRDSAGFENMPQMSVSDNDVELSCLSLIPRIDY